MLQKFPADEFTATTKVTLNPRFEGEKFGFVVMGLDYSYVGLTYKGTKLYIVQAIVKDADKHTAENENASTVTNQNTVYLRIKVTTGGICSFSYSENGKTFADIGVSFKAREGRWIGAKIGFFLRGPANPMTPAQLISTGFASKNDLHQSIFAGSILAAKGA